MNILLVTLAYPESETQTNLYTDLMSEFKKNGHDVTVVCQREKRSNKPTELVSHRSIPVLRVRTGNVTKTNMIEKGISTLRLENQFIKAIKSQLTNKRFDLVLYSTPPITFEKVIKYFKKTQYSTTYLLLKDIFPQNAVDISIIKENSIIHKYFKKKEKALYRISDFIGCMSEGNKNYLIEHNPEIDVNKIEVNPNTIIPTEIKNEEREGTVRKLYRIPDEALLFIYGGNLGKPQGIDFLIKSLDQYKNQKDVYFLIVGSGTDFNKIQQYIALNNPTNISLETYMPKAQYNELVKAADIGMIYLDERFTIPNIPSRLTAYMNSSKPVLAVTDMNTDLKEIIKDAKCGYFSPAGNLELFKKTVETIKDERNLLHILGNNGREYLEEHFHVSKTYEIIMKHFDR
ncbi:glycosyltransferase family 4 protein [Sporosarcina sp. FSL K6-1522]|uniref:glycosyltransferase family 4 protein n=1 Tax=Sporosarcina sp. FSL K6-1522 TaxID=2921554 RepID=UPI00315A38C5